MAAKNLREGRAYGNGNGNGASGSVDNGVSQIVASEFDHTLTKATYIDDVAMPVVVMDCDHNVEYVNAAAAALAGRAPEACVGHKFWDFFENPNCRAGTCSAARAVREAAAISGMETEVTVQGKKLPIRTWTSPRFDEHDKVIGVVQILQDASEDARFSEEVSRLSGAARAGQLSERGRSEEFHGRNRDIVAEINAMLDAVIDPLNVAAGYVDRISKGDIPDKITDKYNGDFNTIKNNLNTCIDALGGLISEMNNMSSQHDAGDIDVRIAADKFQGAYKAMAMGVNDMVFGHIAVKKKAMACISEFGRGNFEAPLDKFPGKKVFINETIEQMRANLKALIADADMLSKAAVEGKLATRADASQAPGRFPQDRQGVNDTLDAVIGPLNVTAEYVDKVSKGVIPPDHHHRIQGPVQRHQDQPQLSGQDDERPAERDRQDHQGRGRRSAGHARRRHKFVGGWNKLVKPESTTRSPTSSTR
jgi:PAS domain S-box-containing protein